VRVLFLTHRLPYAPNRGDRTRAYHMLRHLAAQAEVDLFSLVHDGDEARHASDIRPYVTTLTTARVRRVHQIYRGLNAVCVGAPLTHALLDAFGSRRMLAELIQRRPPDVLFAYCSGMAQFAFEPGLRSLPLVLDMVDVDSEKWGQLSKRASGPLAWVYSREARRLGAFEKAAAARATVSLVVNERERYAMAQLAPDARICIVGNGVDVETFKPPAPPVEEPRVVFCGVMNYPPNIEAAVWLAREVWPLVTARHSTAQLTLLGANPTGVVSALRQPGIEVTGTVPDVREFLWRSAVAVAPLRVARGVQNKVIEAVAAGLPCVITPQVAQGLPPSVLRACVSADSPAAVAAQIVRLLRCTPSERRAMASSAHVSDLAWGRQLAGLFEILKDAARQRGPESPPESSLALQS